MQSKCGPLFLQYCLDAANLINSVEPTDVPTVDWIPLRAIEPPNMKQKSDKRGWEKLNGAYGKRVGKCATNQISTYFHNHGAIVFHRMAQFDGHVGQTRRH